jgi:CheY-like chemotaxis protein
MRVLIVDDEEDVRETLRDLFELEGFEVETARDGAEAFAKITRDKYSALVLDLLMPVMDGHELYARLKGDPALAALPIFVSTSLPSHAPKGSTIVPKPIDVDRLIALVRRACQTADGV